MCNIIFKCILGAQQDGLYETNVQSMSKSVSGAIWSLAALWYDTWKHPNEDVLEVFNQREKKNYTSLLNIHVLKHKINLAC